MALRLSALSIVVAFLAFFFVWEFGVRLRIALATVDTLILLEGESAPSFSELGLERLEAPPPAWVLLGDVWTVTVTEGGTFFPVAPWELDKAGVVLAIVGVLVGDILGSLSAQLEIPSLEGVRGTFSGTMIGSL